MELQFTNADQQFRQFVRRRIAELLPADIQQRQRSILELASNAQDQRRWFAILAAEGWSVPAWPVEWGGTEWTPIQRFIFEDELYMADAPEFHWIGSHMVGPILHRFGTSEQQERFLPRIRTGEHLWAQGFSEPGAGSDLASLSTRARLDSGRYIVSGQKIWTSGAYQADWGLFLVKTEVTEKPQRSISVLLVDLRSAGITIRRIPQLNGEAHLCEVFLDNVEVPVNQLVGEPGKGWTYAKVLLEHERTASSFIHWIRRELKRTKELAAVMRRRGFGQEPLQSRYWAARLEQLEAEVSVHEWSVLRVLAGDESVSSSVAASVLKLRGAELQQATTELQVDLLGWRALRDWGIEQVDGPGDDNWPSIVPGRTNRALAARAATIYGGTKQIQKNILARLAFGL